MILCISVLSVVSCPFSFLILLIWFFSLCFSMSLANGLSILFILSKNQLLALSIFAMVSFVSFGDQFLKPYFGFLCLWIQIKHGSCWPSNSYLSLNLVSASRLYNHYIPKTSIWYRNRCIKSNSWFFLPKSSKLSSLCQLFNCLSAWTPPFHLLFCDAWLGHWGGFHSLSCIRLFATLWSIADQAP